jgi:glycosyltransferase involved in cell wall biosynthesis
LKKKLNILFLCGWYPSKVLPTNGNFIQRHAEAVSLRNNVTVIHIISDGNLKEKAKIETNLINGIETHIGYIKTTKNPFIKLIRFWRMYKKLLKKVSDFNLVHLNELFPFGLFALHLKWIKKKSFIISEHCTDYLIVSKTKINYFKKIISKLIIKNANVVCTVSNYQQNEMINLGYKGNYETVGNVVDTELFIPKKKEATFLKLLHVSSLKNDHKNIEGMLQVAKLLEDEIGYFEWVFIGGDGSKYKKYIKELNIKKAKISFLNHQNHSEIVYHLQEASICISFSNYETFGIVIPEAIACGTPVIATNTGISSDFDKLPFCKVIATKNKEVLYTSILNYKTIFANLNADNMHSFIKHKFSKEVISDKFSFLYHKSIKN